MRGQTTDCAPKNIMLLVSSCNTGDASAPGIHKINLHSTSTRILVGQRKDLCVFWKGTHSVRLSLVAIPGCRAAGQ